MSWERKLWEEEQKTQTLLEELSYSQEQRRIDELFHGEDALDEEWASQRQQGSPAGWLLGSPYHRGLGGQVYAYLWCMGICLALALLAFAVRGWVGWQRSQQQQQYVQQLGNPHGASGSAPAGGSGAP